MWFASSECYSDVQNCVTKIVFLIVHFEKCFSIFKIYNFATITAVSFIVELEISAGRWEEHVSVRWSLSPADTLMFYEMERHTIFKFFHLFSPTKGYTSFLWIVNLPCKMWIFTSPYCHCYWNSVKHNNNNK